VLSGRPLADALGQFKDEITSRDGIDPRVPLASADGVLKPSPTPGVQGDEVHAALRA
jgi:hypothetical protein